MTLRMKEFLAAATKDKKWRGGPPCRTCAHKARAALEKDALEFNHFRKIGKTDTPWSYFVKKHARVKHGYALDRRSLIRHLEMCLGKEIF